MKSPGDAAPLEYARGPLESALATIHRARALKSGRPGRLEGLLHGLEGVLAARPEAAGRERDGGRALTELDQLLVGAGGTGGTAAIREFLEPIVDHLIDALLVTVAGPDGPDVVSMCRRADVQDGAQEGG